MDWETLGQVVWWGFRNGVAYALFASGLTLIFGVMRVVNFAHGSMYMFVAMLVYVFATLVGVNFFVSIVLSLGLAGLLGFVTNRMTVQPLLSARHAGVTTMLSTLGLSFILLYGSAAAWGSDVVPIDYPISGLLHIGGVAVTRADLVLVALGGAIIAGLHLFLARAKLGKQMRATAENTMGAQLTGINALRVYDYTLAAGVLLAGVGGILTAAVRSVHVAMGEPMLILGFAIVIIAGMRSVRGVIAVGLVIGIAEALFGQYVSHEYKLAFVYGIMITGLLWRPKGVFARG